MKNDHLIVNKSGIRLDKFLADNLVEYSRSKLQKYIKNGNITVNGEVQPARYQLNLNDEIIINITNEVSGFIMEPQDLPLDIIYEDDELLVINKQSGITVHPGTGNTDGTLANALAYHCLNLSDLNGPTRPGIVHRLDRDTSGLIVVAKTNYVHMKLAEQFANRLVKKVYFGITWGAWKSETGSIDQPIMRKRNDPTSFFVNINGKEARTSYQVVKESQYFSQVNYFPHTGRTHQIRVHSAFIGNPIIGDAKYGGGSARIKGFMPEISNHMKILFQGIQGHILHAQKLSFRHPRKEQEMQFEADQPVEIQSIINKIEQLNV